MGCQRTSMAEAPVASRSRVMDNGNCEDGPPLVRVSRDGQRGQACSGGPSRVSRSGVALWGRLCMPPRWLLGVAAAKQYFGSNGLYAVAGLSGLVDLDAITLSLSQMLKSSQLEPQAAWRLLLERLPGLRLDSEQPIEISGWEFRSPHYLRVQWN